MIDRQLPGEAAMSNQSRPRALSLNPPSPLNHSVAFSPVFAGPQTMIVRIPEFSGQRPPLAFCHAAAAPSPWAS